MDQREQVIITIEQGRSLIATLPDGSTVVLPAGTVLREPETRREYTPEENFAALKHMYPALAAVHERASEKYGVHPWDVTQEQIEDVCPALKGS